MLQRLAKLLDFDIPAVIHVEAREGLLHVRRPPAQQAKERDAIERAGEFFRSLSRLLDSDGCLRAVDLVHRRAQ